MNFRPECFHFRGHVPCRPHKEKGVHCDGCEDFRLRAGRILIIKLGAAGDVIRTTPLLSPLRREFPDHLVTWVTDFPDLLPAVVDDPVRLDTETLVWLLPLLPQMGEIQPGRDFGAQVLARTTRRRSWRRRVHEGLQGRAEALERGFAGISQRWARAWQRPRFALEAAYFGVLLIVALCATPVSPLREAPPQALAVVQAGPQHLSDIVHNLGELPAGGAALGSSVWAAATDRTAALLKPMSRDLERRRAQAAPVWTDLRARADTLVARVRHGRIPEAGLTLKDLAGATAELWQRWWQAEAAATAPAQEAQPRPQVRQRQHTDESAGGGARGNAPRRLANHIWKTSE